MRRRDQQVKTAAFWGALVLFAGGLSGCSKDAAETPVAPAAGASAGVNAPPPPNYTTSGKRMQPPPPGMQTAPPGPR